MGCGGPYGVGQQQLALWGPEGSLWRSRAQDGALGVQGGYGGSG